MKFSSLTLILLLAGNDAFTPTTTSIVRRHLVSVLKSTVEEEQVITAPSPLPPPPLPNDDDQAPPVQDKEQQQDDKYWKLGPTMFNPKSRPLPPKLQQAMEFNTHVQGETQDDLGRGVFVVSDWRKAWYTYESPQDNPNLIDPDTGYAEYVIDEIDGTVPENLVGVLYRNGPGKFGFRNGERVAHVLDADGLIIQVTFPKPIDNDEKERQFTFRSRFIETKALAKERKANQFVYRGTFGTGPRAFFDKPPRTGPNSDPTEPSLLSKVVGRAFKTDIKNTANTQVVSFGGKVLALFEAGLPHSIDPTTLEIVGEDDLNGSLKQGIPVKLGGGIPKEYEPDSIIGGSAHTAHPQRCPKTGNLVGWHWSQVVLSKSLQVTISEWSEKDFSLVASKTVELANCELAPHDMAMTDNHVLLKVNALEMDRNPFIMGVKGPAAALEMNGRAPVKAWVIPRPTAAKQFEPFAVTLPPCFSIHFSHAYEDKATGNIISYFSGWPPSDAKDFLGAWGGFAPEFDRIPPTFLWRMEINPSTQKCVKLDIAPGSYNACVEHPLVHPNFLTSKANYVYTSASNLIGDSTAPCGVAKLQVEDVTKDYILRDYEFNTDIDAYWFGTRCFSGEPLIVPKYNGNPENETEAFLICQVKDSVRDKTYLAVFDLERDLKQGPVCKLWLKSGIPHGIHGCFAPEGPGTSSVFC